MRTYNCLSALRCTLYTLPYDPLPSFCWTIKSNIVLRFSMAAMFEIIHKYVESTLFACIGKWNSLAEILVPIVPQYLRSLNFEIRID